MARSDWILCCGSRVNRLCVCDAKEKVNEDDDKVLNFNYQVKYEFPVPGPWAEEGCDWGGFLFAFGGRTLHFGTEKYEVSYGPPRKC